MSKKHRNPVQWYRDNESWVWRILLMAAALVNMWLCSKFISQEMFWKMQRRGNKRLEALEQDMCVVADRMKFRRHKVKEDEEE